jgi:hypothetical protein
MEVPSSSTNRDSTVSRADSRSIQVLDGQAAIQQGDQHKELSKGRELALNGAWKVSHFDLKLQVGQDPLLDMGQSAVRI